MPAHGYHALFEKLLDHSDISILLSTTFDKTMEAEYDHCFNSMPIDEYFDYCFGELPYRSIKFEHGLQEPFEFQVPTVNFTDTGMYTRVTNWQLYPGTICGERRKYTNEIPCSYVENNMERYYPVKTVDGKPQDIYRQYTRKATKLHKITFIGRCGQYIYYDMHQVVANSLKIAEEFLRNRS
jgi:UDP-galactopyranose mutase